MEVTITGLDRVRNPEPTLKGHLILAYFTADIGPLTVKGCALVRQASGTLDAWLPRMTDPKAKTMRSISFNDGRVQDAVRQKALQTFRRLGGDEDESRLAQLHTIAPPPVRTAVTVTRRVERVAVQEEPAE